MATHCLNENRETQPFNRNQWRTHKTVNESATWKRLLTNPNAKLPSTRCRKQEAAKPCDLRQVSGEMGNLLHLRLALSESGLYCATAFPRRFHRRNPSSPKTHTLDTSDTLWHLLYAYTSFYVEMSMKLCGLSLFHTPQNHLSFRKTSVDCSRRKAKVVTNGCAALRFRSKNGNTSKNKTKQCSSQRTTLQTEQLIPRIGQLRLIHETGVLLGSTCWLSLKVML